LQIVDSSGGLSGPQEIDPQQKIREIVAGIHPPSPFEQRNRVRIFRLLMQSETLLELLAKLVVWRCLPCYVQREHDARYRNYQAANSPRLTHSSATIDSALPHRQTNRVRTPGPNLRNVHKASVLNLRLTPHSRPRKNDPYPPVAPPSSSEFLSFATLWSDEWSATSPAYPRGPA
jgi:hypothetical protein